VLCIDGRRSFPKTGGVQAMGSIMGKAQADRERDRDCCARVRSKRPETRSLEPRTTRDKKRMRNRYGDQIGCHRALRVCHVDPGCYSDWDCALLLGCGMSKVARTRMRALRRLPDLAALLPRGDRLGVGGMEVTRNHRPSNPRRSVATSDIKSLKNPHSMGFTLLG
jgi:hypothetical protein